jgi:hypothetical protein
VEWSGIRTARIPSFSMKRAVLPEMLEKKTRRGTSVAVSMVHP